LRADRFVAIIELFLVREKRGFPMNARIDQKEKSKIAIIDSADVMINTTQDALDLMADVRYHYDCDKIIIRKENLSEDFFELKTGLAGDVLQKYTNYYFKIAIIGDFSVYGSKSLNDFIYECNNGVHIFFLSDEKSAVEALHGV
jgi:hypothetical protein